MLTVDFIVVTSSSTCNLRPQVCLFLQGMLWIVGWLQKLLSLRFKKRVAFTYMEDWLVVSIKSIEGLYAIAMEIVLLWSKCQ